jgi:hypothetical protein
MSMSFLSRPTWHETQHQYHAVGSILTLPQSELPTVKDRTAAWTGENVGLVKAFQYEIMQRNVRQLWVEARWLEYWPRRTDGYFKRIQRKIGRFRLDSVNVYWSSYINKRRVRTQRQPYPRIVVWPWILTNRFPQMCVESCYNHIVVRHENECVGT